MREHYDTQRWAERRRPFDALEARIVQLALAGEDDEQIVDALRYVVSFARLSAVRNADGVDVEVGGVNRLHAMYVQDTLERRLAEGDSIWPAVRELPDLLRRTRAARESLLTNLPLDRASLEEEVTTRKLAVVCGGGGGAGYVYPGCFELLERKGLTPDLMVGTSIGALTSMFRARRRRYDPAPQIAAARSLSWSEVFRVLDTEHRYGLPATLRMYLQAALGPLFKHPSEDRQLRMSDLEIPLYTVVTGITVDALKHDLGYYEHLLDGELRASTRARATGAVKSMGILREFLSRPEALIPMVIGRTPGTEDFDVVDAAGFSAAIPGVLHYDVLRDDPRMTRILDDLYARYGITRLGEGGMVANVPSRIAWESVVGGKLGRRNVFVLALDCFAPGSNLAWYPFQQLVRSANVDAHRQFADLYVPFPRTLSPINLVPPLRDLLLAMRWGRNELEPHMPFVSRMMRPIAVLAGGEPD